MPATRSSPLVLLRLPLGGSAAAGGSNALQLSLVTLLTAWCCSEVIRYSFFAFKVGQASWVDCFIVLLPTLHVAVSAPLPRSCRKPRSGMLRCLGVS